MTATSSALVSWRRQETSPSRSDNVEWFTGLVLLLRIKHSSSNQEQTRSKRDGGVLLLRIKHSSSNQEQTRSKRDGGICTHKLRNTSNSRIHLTTGGYSCNKISYNCDKIINCT